jgi:hypothetical protein
MAIGLSVDYSVHIVHKFMTVHGGAATGNASRQQSLKLVGPHRGHLYDRRVIALRCILNIFRVFFKLIFRTVVLFGGLVGLLVPIMLRLVQLRPASAKLPHDGAATDTDERAGTSRRLRIVPTVHVD